MSELAMIDPGVVRPNPDQPRQDFNADELAALTDSVRQHGVIVPITVRADNGGYVIVAGERRLRAAIAAEVAPIPAHILPAGDNSDVLAVVENIARADLNPVEEGHAYQAMLARHTEAEIANLVSRPVERVRDRLLLAALPDVAQAKIVSGDIGLAAARVLVHVQSTSPDVAAALASGVGSRYNGDVLARNPDEALRSLLRGSTRECPECEGERVIWPDPNDEEREETCPTCQGFGTVTGEDTPEFFALSTWVGLDEDDLAMFDGEQADELAALWATYLETAHAGQPSWFHADRPRLPDVATDAARAYGCLLEFNRTSYITDRAFAFDLVKQAILDATKNTTEKRSRQGADRPKKRPKADMTPEELAVEEAETARRKAAREADTAARREGREFNLDLGVALATKLAAPKVTTEAMKALVGELLDQHLADRRGFDGGFLPSGLAMYRRLIEPQPAKKNGDAIYPRKSDAVNPAVEAIYRELKAARNPEQVLGVWLRVVAAAAFTDLRGITKADLEGCHGHLHRRDEHKALITKLLPKQIRDRLPARRGLSWND